MLIFLILYQVPFIIGFFTTFISFIVTFFELMTSKSYIITFFSVLFFGSIILGIDMFWSALIGITQMFQLYGTVLFLPLFDLDNVRKILFCKSHIVFVFFVLLTIMSAFKYLGNIPAIVMSISLILMALKGIKSKSN